MSWRRRFKFRARVMRMRAEIASRNRQLGIDPVMCSLCPAWFWGDEGMDELIWHCLKRHHAGGEGFELSTEYFFGGRDDQA